MVSSNVMPQFTVRKNIYVHFFLHEFWYPITPEVGFSGLSTLRPILEVELIVKHGTTVVPNKGGSTE